jgi:septal ring factor EnvC (AmiA/AmiB activator)
MMRSCRRALSQTITAIALLAFCAPWGLAQETPKPDQLKKMYDDALAQLKDAQNRKNELSGQNEKLKTANTKLTERVAELEKQLAAAGGQVAQLKEEQAGWAEQTFWLRSHYAAWQAFIRLYPRMGVRWEYYLGNSFPGNGHEALGIYDPAWPFSAAG